MIKRKDNSYCLINENTNGKSEMFEDFFI